MKSGETFVTTKCDRSECSTKADRRVMTIKQTKRGNNVSLYLDKSIGHRWWKAFVWLMILCGTTDSICEPGWKGILKRIEPQFAGGQDSMWTINQIEENTASRGSSEVVYNKLDIGPTTDPWPGIPLGPSGNPVSNLFFAHFSSLLNVPETGKYQIYLTSDDGSNLYIDGEKVLDNDGLHNTVTRETIITLPCGLHVIEVKYFDKTSDSHLVVSWKWNGQPDPPKSLGVKTTLSSEWICFHGSTSRIPGWNGTLYGYNASLVNARRVRQAEKNIIPGTEAKVVYEELNMHTTGAWPKAPKDRDGNRVVNYFFAHFRGMLSVPKTGRYRIHLTSNDGSLLYLDNRRIISNDGPGSARTKSTTQKLRNGNYSIEVKYFEGISNAVLKVSWEWVHPTPPTGLSTKQHLGSRWVCFAIPSPTLTSTPTSTLTGSCISTTSPTASLTPTNSPSSSPVPKRIRSNGLAVQRARRQVE
eukprot:gb/GECG01000312.1/.p1 GENE.gb/GECG01000312.1/~~gb/GECG01000312.1/.p1  ORF type:complete len:471 (+),score=18.84 gb/GECG01000312.1/:1-1413(+)